MNTSLHDSFDWNIIEGFVDIFDTVDEITDVIEFSKEELNKYFSSGHLDMNLNEEMQFIEDDETINEEAILSQKFSQLSTNVDEHVDEETSNIQNTKRPRESNDTQSQEGVHSKRVRFITKQDEIDNVDITTAINEIPSYLSLTNNIFRYVTETLIKSKSSMTILNVQQIALLIHRKAKIELDHQVMKVYLQCLLGTLKDSQNDSNEGIDQCYWPMQAQSSMLAYQKSLGLSVTESSEQDEKRTCENFLNKRLRDLQLELELVMAELNDKKNHFVEWTSSMNEILESYMEHHGIKSLEMKRDLQVALTTYDYDLEMLKRKYTNENPTEYQMQVANRLLDLKRHHEKSKRKLLELKYRIFYDKPMGSFDSVDRTLLSSHENENDDDDCIRNKRERMAEHNKMQMMGIKIAEAETEFHQFRMAFDEELASMWKNHRSNVKDRIMSTKLIDLIEQQFKITVDKWRYVYQCRLNHYFRNIDPSIMPPGDHNDDDTTLERRIGFVSSLIIDTNVNSLTPKQLALLKRGPTYVPPYQLSVSSMNLSVDEIIKKRYAPMKHQLNHVLTKNRISIISSMEIQNKLSSLFKHYYSISLTYGHQRRALYEKHLVESIRACLNRHDLILRRTADHMNLFYLGSRKAFELKANEYLKASDAYQVFLEKKSTAEDARRCYNHLKDKIEAINMLLESLKKHKAIDNDLFCRLYVDIKKIKIPSIQFLPDLSKEDTVSVVPIIGCYQSATWKVAKYLNELLKPFVTHTLEDTSFRDDIDCIRKLSDYVHKQKQLGSSKLLCSIKILNYYTLDTSDNIIYVIGYFLGDNLASNKLGNVTIQTIKNLLCIVLHYNFFLYNDKIYKINRGSPHAMPLSDTLSNMYLSVWEKKLFMQLRSNSEFYGRLKDEIFFTWDNSHIEQLRGLLYNLEDKHQNIKFHHTIGPTVDVFRLTIKIEDSGQIFSRLTEKPMHNQYALPYVICHSKPAHSNAIQSALIRFACCCSSVRDFHHERIALEMSYLAAGYSLLFVESHVQQFFAHFEHQNMRYINDQATYEKFRRQCLLHMEKHYARSHELQTYEDSGDLIHLNYIYELGPRCEFENRFYTEWTNIFRDHPEVSNKKKKVLLETLHISKTMSSGRANKNLRRKLLNNELSCLPKFTSCTPYKVYHINRYTSTVLLYDLILLARKLNLFTVDTEMDVLTHQPALIQIELVQQTSIVLLIQIDYLDDSELSVSSWMIRALMKAIFQPSNKILSWGNLKEELEAFLSSKLFTSELLVQINYTDVQESFKVWHNNSLNDELSLVPNHLYDRFWTYSAKSREDSNHKWSLQMAIAYCFEEFLDKTCTLSVWSRCLDVDNAPYAQRTNFKDRKQIERMIEYAACDCLAVTKLSSMLNFCKL